MRVLGVDISQARDPTALAMLQGLDVIHLERVPLGTPYPLVAARIAAVAGGALVAVDAGGVGRAVVDLLRAQGCKVLAVTISGGRMVRRSGDAVTVPKEALLALLVSAIEGRRLKVAKGCGAAAELLAELATFEKRRDSRGRIRIEVRARHHHGDLATAVGLALFAQGLQQAGEVSAPRNQKIA